MTRPTSKQVRNFISQILPDYFWDVLRYWWLIAVAICLAIVDGAQDVFQLDIPWWLWAIIILLSIHIAQFLAWNDMRKERDRLRRLQVTDLVLEKVAEYRSTQIKMQNEKIDGEQAFGAWWERYMALRKEIIAYLAANISKAESLLFDRVGTFDMVFPAEDLSPLAFQRAHRRSWIARDHKWLADMAMDYSRQRRRPEAEG